MEWWSGRTLENVCFCETRRIGLLSVAHHGRVVGNGWNGVTAPKRRNFGFWGVDEIFGVGWVVVSDHMTCNPPHPVRFGKLTHVQSDQYSGGGPPGNIEMLDALFFLHLFCMFCVCVFF